MPTNRKPQRPRLEVRDSSNVWANMTDLDEVALGMMNNYGNATTGYFALRDAKRLHAFLAKAIAYLEARKVHR